jgi:CDP-diacylglycerol--glycerol-3-phosphate 3-phosphatidyltransferase
VKPDVGTALATWANAITAARLLLSPLMFWLIPDDDAGSWVAFTFWFLLSVSDFVDGFIARRRGPTRSGAFLDPLADKVLILGAMFTLVGRDVFWIVPVAIIAARELVISVYRSVISTKGISMPASRAAKYKTLAQQLAVGFALCPLTALDAKWLWNLCLWGAVFLALYSAVQYFWRMHEAKARAVLPPDVSVV